MGKKKRVLIGICIFLVLVVGYATYYLNTYYRSSEEADKFIKSDNQVAVKEIKEGYFFDGPGDDKAMIFYPGGKVETKAYARLMNKLAKEGIDTFLLDMPFHLAVLNKNAADKIISKYQYDTYYMGGHSLGGVMAIDYANDNSEKIDGVFLLAAYPNKKIDGHFNVLSIYGSNDKVLNIKKYEKAEENYYEQFIDYEKIDEISSDLFTKKFFKEIVIDGGNHASFADYGKQKGDGEATISVEEQVDRTVEEIINYVGELKKLGVGGV